MVGHDVGGPLRDSIRAVLAREPRTLGELEAALGVSLARDPRGEEAWLVRRKSLVAGLDFVFAAFVGRDLAATPDPMLDEVRLQAKGVDVRAEAIAVLGPGERRGGEETFDIYHRGLEPSRTPEYLAWPRERGVLEIHHDPSWAFWTRHEGPYAAAWTPDLEAELYARVAALLGAPLDDAALARAFGALAMSGRVPERFLRRPTWKLAVSPIDGPPKAATITLRPGLGVDALLRGLGWPATLVATSGVHQASAHVIDPQTRRVPVLFGSRVEIGVESVQEGRRSAVDVPAQRAYETAGLVATSVRVELERR